MQLTLLIFVPGISPAFRFARLYFCVGFAGPGVRAWGPPYSDTYRERRTFDTEGSDAEPGRGSITPTSTGTQLLANGPGMGTRKDYPVHITRK